MFEHLNIILSFFVPNVEQITRTAWFRDYCDIQLVALKMAYYGHGDKVTLQNLLCPHKYEQLKDFLKQYDDTFRRTLVEGIPKGDYLFSLLLFAKEVPTYQLRILMLKMVGADNQIDLVNNSIQSKLHEHLDQLIKANIINYEKPFKHLEHYPIQCPVEYRREFHIQDNWGEELTEDQKWCGNYWNDYFIALDYPEESSDDNGDNGDNDDNDDNDWIDNDWTDNEWADNGWDRKRSD
jgi:hypothetical protein